MTNARGAVLFGGAPRKGPASTGLSDAVSSTVKSSTVKSSPLASNTLARSAASSLRENAPERTIVFAIAKPPNPSPLETLIGLSTGMFPV